MAIGNVWKAEEKFVVQFSNVKPKEKKIIMSSFQDWNKSGSGFHKDGTEIYLFSNTNLDERGVFSLVKNMPFPFTEEKKSGKTRQIRTKHIAKQKSLTEKKNSDKVKIRKPSTCSRCGKLGHNSRRCDAVSQ